MSEVETTEIISEADELASLMDRSSGVLPPQEQEIKQEALPVVQENQTDQGQPANPENNGFIPRSRLNEETEKRRALEKERDEYRSRIEFYERQLAANNQPRQTEQAPPEMFENPDGFVRHTVEPLLAERDRAALYNAELVAEARFGADTVKEAIAAFDSLLESGRLNPVDYHRVRYSPNPFAEATKWHSEQKVREEVGTDIGSYRAKLQEQLLSDPEFVKRALEKARSTAGASSPSQQNRPAINLPSISKVGAAAIPSRDGDASEEDEIRTLQAGRNRRR